MSRVDYGQFELELDEVITLKPTAKAYMQIDARFGGLRPALESLNTMSLDTLAHVVAYGAGKGQRDIVDLRNQIFRAGVINVMPQVTEFLVCMLDPTGNGRDDEDSPPGE